MQFTRTPLRPHAVPSSRGFNAACNDPCVEEPLAAGCTNFDPSSGVTTATNAPGDEPVCLALRDPSSLGPVPMARHIYGMDSLCEVEGEASILVGGENKTTGAAGTLLLGGAPCMSRKRKEPKAKKSVAEALLRTTSQPPSGQATSPLNSALSLRSTFQSVPEQPRGPKPYPISPSRDAPCANVRLGTYTPRSLA